MTDMNLFSNGARLVRRHQRLVWWIFFVNLVLGWLISAPVRNSFAPYLDHTIAGQRLVQHFDLGPVIELAREPAIQIHTMWMGSMHIALIFLIYMIFIDGGVLTVYREDRKLTKAEFFEMSGGYFWRMVRLVLLSLIPFAIIGGLFSVVSDWSDKLSDNAASDRTGFWVLTIGCLIFWVLLLFVRAWFDLAQCMTVAGNDRGMLRNTWRSFVVASKNFGKLIRTYISIHIIGIVSTCVLLSLWVFIPHRATGASFLVLELLLLINIAVRLWQKAACMTWWEAQPLPLPPPVPEPALAFAADAPPMSEQF
jgi:hypothetical protein